MKHFPLFSLYLIISLIPLLCFKFISISSSLREKKSNSKLDQNNQGDWNKVNTLVETFGNFLSTDIKVLEKCTPKSWKKDNNIKSNKDFLTSIDSFKVFFEKLSPLREFLGKNINYDCHYAKKNKMELKEIIEGKSKGEAKPIENGKGVEVKKENNVKEDIKGDIKEVSKESSTTSALPQQKKEGGFGSFLKNGLNTIGNAVKDVANKVEKTGEKIVDDIFGKKNKDNIKPDNNPNPNPNANPNANSNANASNSKPKKNNSDEEIQKNIKASDGKVFEFLKVHFQNFKEGLEAILKSKVFDSTVEFINCLKKFNPSENLKKLVKGLARKHEELKKGDYISASVDFLCQWDKLKIIFYNIEKGLDSKNTEVQWKFFSVALENLVNILSV